MANPLYSETSFFLCIAFIFICIINILAGLKYIKKRYLSLEQYLVLPSILIPTVILFLHIIPITLSLFDTNFYIKYANPNHLEETVILVVSYSTILIAGIFFGKHKFLNSKYIKKQKKLYRRKLDILFLSKKYAKILLFFLIVSSILLVPLYFGFRIELLWQGGRSYSTEGPLGFTNNPVLRSLIPFSIIFSLIFSIIGGIYFSYLEKKIIFIIPIMSMLPRIATLSRAFILPLILFIFPFSLLGVNFNYLFYLVLIIGSIVSSILIISLRGLSQGGIDGLLSSLGQSNLGNDSSFISFFEDNSNLGLLSQIIAHRDLHQDFIDGLIKWILTVLPIPSFIDQALVAPPSVASLIGVTNVGLPMPLIGELYYQMGWFGLLIIFPIGYWIGRLEGKIIIHISIFKRAYWPDVFVWLSSLYCFILSFHSASRASSRVLFYSIFFIWFLEFIVPSKANIHNP